MVVAVQGVVEEHARPAGASPDARSAAAHLLSLFGRRSSGSLGRADSATMKRSASGTQPMCLICLENLTAEDFQVCRLCQTCSAACCA